MADTQDIVMESVLFVLSEKIEEDVLKKANTKAIRKKLLRTITESLVFELFREGRVNMAPGFGNVTLKEIKEKDKKIFDRVTKTMVIKHISGKKIVYVPGDTVREFL